jgi:hypothetical protein
MYRSKAVTQRDGSKLANSNCRIASICSGIQFHSLGKIPAPTAGVMRTHTSDQAGGTDSADAAEAWQRGYRQSLFIRDGRTWSDAVTDLVAGRMVHIDVWHASAYVCRSGDGRYGHTMAIAPERSGTRWLVSDPWCLPAKWSWLEGSLLQAGAEEWGRRVYRSATGGPDWPVNEFGIFAGWPDFEDFDDRRWAILRRIVRELMTRYQPDGEHDPSPTPVAETSGPQPIMFTSTLAHPEGDDVAMQVIDARPGLGDMAAGVDFFDSPGGARIGEASKAATVEIVGVPMDGSTDHLNLGWRAIWATTQAVNGVSSRKIVYTQTAWLTNQRPLPPPPSGGASAEEIAAAKLEEYNRVKAGAKATHTVSVQLPPPPSATGGE